MNYPKITVITPSYNQGCFIEETILSVINQNYPNLEYIVIDGGSSDGTQSILQKYNSSIHFWISEKDKGQTDAINKGILKATGDIICWINSDDILMPWALKMVAEYFSMHEDCDILNGYTMRIDKESNILYTHFVPRPLRWFASHGIFYINQPSMFFRKRLITELGLLNETYHARMDQEFVIRILTRGKKFGKINKVLAAIRIHEDTKTSQNGTIWTDDLTRLQNEYGSCIKVKPDTLGICSYGIYKIISLDYIKQFLFKAKWSGKSVLDFYKALAKG